jgi:hypothetical protein
MPAPKQPKSVMHSLGAFFGHIVRGVKTPVQPAKPERREVRREVETETRDTPQGRVVLKRTTIEEIEVRPPERSD